MGINNKLDDIVNKVLSVESNLLKYCKVTNAQKKALVSYFTIHIGHEKIITFTQAVVMLD